MLAAQPGTNQVQSQPIVQVIETSRMEQEGAKGRLLVVLSDVPLFISALIPRVAEQEVQDVKNNSLVQLRAWRTLERSGHTIAAMDAHMHVALHRVNIGHPKQAQSPQ